MGGKYSIAFVLLGIVLPLFGAPLRIVSYNVENLFHPAHDTVGGVEKEDLEWTAEGERRWTYTRYYQKIENIARVLTNIGEWEGVDIAGLQEVENRECVKRLCTTLRRGEYDFVHYDSPDRRGIDVALIYKKTRIDTIRTRAMRVSSSLNEEWTTRDILYVCARVDQVDTLHLFVCHLPSQRGGIAETEWKRLAAKQVLQDGLDSVLAINEKALIIVMGDMNSEPPAQGYGLRGVRYKVPVSGEGTHKHHGQWACLDHFYTSAALDSLSTARIYDALWIKEADERYLGLRPTRTFNGFRYQSGYSDHLPLVLDATLR